jgi:tetratricopeptide (TPR) repeat protein
MPNPFLLRRQFDKAIELDRNDIARQAFGFLRHWDLANSYELAGRQDDAIREWEQSLRMLDYQKLADAVNRSFEAGGYKAALRTFVKGLESERSRGENIPPNVPARIYLYLGEKEQAFVWLEKAYMERDTSLAGLKAGPEYDGIRSDPRFQDLLRRIGLAQ